MYREIQGAANRKNLVAMSSNFCYASYFVHCGDSVYLKIDSHCIFAYTHPHITNAYVYMYIIVYIIIYIALNSVYSIHI